MAGTPTRSTVINLRADERRRALIDRAFEEHEEAKRIIAALESGNEQNTAQVLELQGAIAAHVAEEEGELFPRVRATDLDLFGLGVRIAVRRSEILSELTRKPLPMVSGT